MNQITALIFATLSLNFGVDSFVNKWNNAILQSILTQQSDANTPKSVKKELQEVMLYFHPADSLNSDRNKESIRRSFISYIEKKNMLPLTTGGIIVERLRPGEYQSITFYLLTKNSQGYKATAFSYTSDWEISKSNTIASSYVDNLLSHKYCYFQGRNDNLVIITRFTKNGETFISQYFASYSICTSLEKLDAL